MPKKITSSAVSSKEEIKKAKNDLKEYRKKEDEMLRKIPVPKHENPNVRRALEEIDSEYWKSMFDGEEELERKVKDLEEKSSSAVVDGAVVDIKEKIGLVHEELNKVVWQRDKTTITGIYSFSLNKTGDQIVMSEEKVISEKEEGEDNVNLNEVDTSSQGKFFLKISVSGHRPNDESLYFLGYSAGCTKAAKAIFEKIMKEIIMTVDTHLFVQRKAFDIAYKTLDSLTEPVKVSGDERENIIEKKLHIDLSVSTLFPSPLYREFRDSYVGQNYNIHIDGIYVYVQMGTLGALGTFNAFEILNNVLNDVLIWSHWEEQGGNVESAKDKIRKGIAETEELKQSTSSALETHSPERMTHSPTGGISMDGVEGQVRAAPYYAKASKGRLHLAQLIYQLALIRIILAV